jgi:hypothetical protein
MHKSSSKSKNGGKEKKAKSVSLKDLNPEKSIKKVKGGASNGNRQIKTHFV